MASEYLVIKIVNWEKYQAEAKRYKNPDWFRMNCGIRHHALWDVLSPLELKLFLLLLLLACEHWHQTGVLTVGFGSLSSQLGGKRRPRRSQVEAMMETLSAVGVVEFQIVDANEMTKIRRLRNGTERNITEQGEMTDLDLLEERECPPTPVQKLRVIPPESQAFIAKCKPPKDGLEQ